MAFPEARKLYDHFIVLNKKLIMTRLISDIYETLDDNNKERLLGYVKVLLDSQEA